MLYLNPLRTELEDLKKTVVGIEKKEADRESYVGAMKSDIKSGKSHFNKKESDGLNDEYMNILKINNLKRTLIWFEYR